MATGFGIALLVFALAQVFADVPAAKQVSASNCPAIVNGPAPAPSPAPAAVAATPRLTSGTVSGAAVSAPATAMPAQASNSYARWYYLPAGWYLLVPAGPNAQVPPVGSATGVAPPAVAMPAGLPPTAAPVYYVPARAPASNVAPSSWQHNNQNDDEWPADHGG